jgi:predicted HTH transcriptional regulator
MQNRSLSKPEQIRALFDTTLQKLSKREIAEKLPQISTSTIELALASLVKEGAILKIGSGKNTTYIRNTNRQLCYHKEVASLHRSSERKISHLLKGV